MELVKIMVKFLLQSMIPMETKYTTMEKKLVHPETEMVMKLLAVAMVQEMVMQMVMLQLVVKEL